MTTSDPSMLDDAIADPSTPTAVADSQLAPQSDVDALDDILLSSLHDLHFILSPSTTILRVSANCLNLLGCEPNLLLGQRLAALVHKDDAHVFEEEIDDALLRPSNSVLIDSGAFDASLSTVAPRRPPFRFYCRIRSVVHLGSDYSVFELVGHYQVKMPASLSPLQLMMPPPGIISIIARPAFSRKGRLMDGMLELKMEQIRLVRLIRKMRREAEEDYYEGDDEEEAVLTVAATPATPAPVHHHHSFQQVEENLYWKSTRRASISGGASKRSRSSPPRLTWMPSPATEQQQQPQTEQQPQQDPIGSPSNTQSNGEASPGDASPKVKLGDAGIPFFIRPEGYERKTSDIPRLPKRKFVAKDYCCSRCGTVESPEWRAGPDGPKTLCNACGRKISCLRVPSSSDANIVHSEVCERAEKGRKIEERCGSIIDCVLGYRVSGRFLYGVLFCRNTPRRIQIPAGLRCCKWVFAALLPLFGSRNMECRFFTDLHRVDICCVNVPLAVLCVRTFSHHRAR